MGMHDNSSLSGCQRLEQHSVRAFLQLPWPGLPCHFQLWWIPHSRAMCMCDVVDKIQLDWSAQVAYGEQRPMVTYSQCGMGVIEDWLICQEAWNFLHHQKGFCKIRSNF